ncbi:hypothetical protein EH221_04735 [bacterium]|nr:MAG: hypothetical protein EH221_04735 [bacterium]
MKFLYAFLVNSVIAVVLVSIFSSSSSSTQDKITLSEGILNVKNFGAQGDGVTDDTPAFQKAFLAAEQMGGTILFIPTGNYLIKGRLDVPAHVVLKGVFEAPTARTQMKGSTLLAVADEGNPEGDPFITLHANSTLKGLTVFYPNQTQTNPPKPYPWTIRGIGDNCSIVDVLLVNPYQAVDFGTHPAGRHYIKNLYAQPLSKGIFVDQCYDVGRIEDVHFWPFWGGWNEDLGKFTLENGVAFIFGRTDWEYVQNCFCIGFSVGFHFIRTKAGTPNVLLNQSGSDIGPVAVLVEECMPHAGISFSNSQMMATVVIKETNKGPVKFTSCGFWGIEETRNHAVLEGDGTTTFTACHFINWDRKNSDCPALHAVSGGLIVNGCEFIDDKPQIRLEKNVKSAVIFGNRLRGGSKIINHSTGSIEIGFNTIE